MANCAGQRRGTIFAPTATAFERTASHSGLSGVTPVHTSRGWKSAISAASPPLWSSWAWESATMSTRANAAIPEVRRHHVLADIELRPRDPPEGRNAAAIHQHPLAVGEYHQQAVALAHVDRGQLQLARADIGREGMPQEQREQDGYRRHGPARAPDRRCDQGGRQRDAEPYGRRRNPPVRFQAGVKPHHLLRGPKQGPRNPRHPVPSGEDRHEIPPAPPAPSGARRTHWPRGRRIPGGESRPPWATPARVARRPT